MNPEMVEAMVETELKHLPEPARSMLEETLEEDDDLKVINCIRIARTFERELRQVAAGTPSMEVLNQHKRKMLRGNGIFYSEHYGRDGLRNYLTPLGHKLLEILEAE